MLSKQFTRGFIYAYTQNIYLNVCICIYIISKVVYKILLWIFPPHHYVLVVLTCWWGEVHSFSLLYMNMLQCITFLMNIWELSRILLIKIILSKHTHIFWCIFEEFLWGLGKGAELLGHGLCAYGALWSDAIVFRGGCNDFTLITFSN